LQAARAGDLDALAWLDSTAKNRLSLRWAGLFKVCILATELYLIFERLPAGRNNQ
jgi:hypothetical protein